MKVKVLLAFAVTALLLSTLTQDSPSLRLQQVTAVGNDVKFSPSLHRSLYPSGIVGSIPEPRPPTVQEPISINEVELNFVGSALWNTMYTVVVQGDYAYCTFMFGLAILDISNSAAPVWISQVYMQGFGALDVELDGQHAYVANSHSGLQIVDVSNPYLPFVVGSYNTPGSARDVEISGNYAFVADIGSLEIIDVSNPGAPRHAASIGAAWNVEVVGNYAFLATGSNRIQVIDISNPEIPKVAASYDTQHPRYAVYASASYDDYVYLIDYETRLHTFRVNDTTLPELIATSQTGIIPYRFEVVGTTLFAPVADFGLRMLDISDPANPTIIANTDSIPYALGVSVIGELAYVADPTAGLYIVNISDTMWTPPTVGHYPISGRVSKTSVHGDAAYVLGTGHVEILDVSDPSNPKSRGQYVSAGGAYYLEIEDSVGYLGHASGLDILDLSTPFTPILLGSLPSGEVLDISLDGDIAYMANGLLGVTAVDVSDPSLPTSIAVLPTAHRVHGVERIDTVLYLVDAGGLRVVDASNPADMSIVGQLNAGDIGILEIFDDRTLAAIVDGGLRVVSVADPINPIIQGGYYSSLTATGVGVRGDHAFISIRSLTYNAQQGIRVLDFSDPANPRLVGQHVTPGTPMAITVSGRHIYAACEYGLLILSMSFGHGDVNDDGDITLADALHLMNYLYAGGPPLLPEFFEGDVDCSGDVGLVDVIRLVNYVLRGGEAPC